MERLRKIFNRIITRRNIRRHGVHVEKKVVINGRPLFSGKNSISIGAGTRIHSGPVYNPIGGDTRAAFITHGSGRISIGSQVGISNSTIVSAASVTIEDHVMIGGSCKIYDTDFHSLNFEQRMQRPDPGIASSPVIIRRGAFIGAHSIILKGVTIGEYAVVGAGSVVTRPVPDCEVWAGNPARMIRKLTPPASEGKP